MSAELYEASVRPTFHHWARLVAGILAPALNVLAVGFLLLILLLGERAWFDWAIVALVVPLLVWLTVRSVRRSVRVARIFARRPVTLRVDRGGVHVVNGGVPNLSFTSLPWHEVVAVVCSPAPAKPGYERGSYLQFVARHEDAIETDLRAASVTFKARILGLSPRAASMTWVAPRSGRPSVRDALDAVRLIAPSHVRIVDSSASLG